MFNLILIVMKRILLLTLAFSIGFLGYAQQLKPVSKDVKDIMQIREYKMPVDPAPPMVKPYTVPSGEIKEARMAGVETEIMETVYDLQSNSNLSNRIWMWEDGTIAAVATRGIEEPAGFTFPDRGTGYNYFDGSAWAPKPTERIESVRVGWPSIAGWGPNGEFVCAHQSGTLPLILNKRENKGSGDWTEMQYDGPDGHSYLWPRATSGGDNLNTIHMLGLTAPSGNQGSPYMGQDGALLYNRSMDGGENWDIQHELIEGIGSDYYLAISADDYVITAKDNIVAFLICSPWYDLAMFKSTDNGETWDKTVIWEDPYPFFDLQTTLTSDTLWAPDGSSDIAIDDNGNVHVVWGIARVARLEAAPPDPGYYSYWPFTDGIGYWNETMEAPIPEAENPHHTLMDTYLDELGMLVGWSQDVNGSGVRLDFEGTNDTPFAVYRELGISDMPSIAINGNMIGLVFSSVTETYLTADGGYNYKHTWTRFSYDLGQTWGDFTDLQAGNIFHLYDECIYPSMAKNATADGAFQIIYMADNLPGVYLDEDEQTEPSTNRIIHNNMDFTIGINDPAAQVNKSLEVSQCYPNPAAGLTQIGVKLNAAAVVGVEFFNMTGQKVFEIPATGMQPGNHTLSFNASSLSPGVYFYTVTAGDETASRKMIVE